MPDPMKRSALDRLIANGATATKVGAGPPPSLIVMDPEQLRALIVSAVSEQLKDAAAEIAESLALELDAREEGTLGELRGQFGKIDAVSRAQVTDQLSALQSAILGRLESAARRLEAVPGTVTASIAALPRPAATVLAPPPAGPPATDPEVLHLLRTLAHKEPPPITVEAPKRPAATYRFDIQRDDFGRILSVVAVPG